MMLAHVHSIVSVWPIHFAVGSFAMDGFAMDGFAVDSH